MYHKTGRPRGRPKRTEPTAVSEPVSNPVNVTETPEFREAVAQAVAIAMKQTREQLVAEVRELRQHGAAAEKASEPWMAELAMELSELNDQGSGRKRVAPEIMRARADARKEMTDRLDALDKAIADAGGMQRASELGIIPTYRLTNKIQLDEQIVDPMWVGPDHAQHPTEINWPGVPNEAMVPLNDAAKAIFGAFMRSIGSTVKVAPDKPLGTTRGGLVVKGGAIPTMRRVSNDGSPNTPESGLRINHRSQPGQYVEKRILGTVAEPARQSV